MAKEKVERTLVSFRLSAEEYQSIENAASTAGESISEFVRKAAMLRTAGGWPMRILANTSYTAPFTYTQIVPSQDTRPTQNTRSQPSQVQEEYVRQI